MQQDYNDSNLMFSNWENENASRGQRKDYLSQMGYSDVDSETKLGLVFNGLWRISWVFELCPHYDGNSTFYERFRAVWFDLNSYSLGFGWMLSSNGKRRRR